MDYQATFANRRGTLREDGGVSWLKSRKDTVHYTASAVREGSHWAITVHGVGTTEAPSDSEVPDAVNELISETEASERLDVDIDYVW